MLEHANADQINAVSEMVLNLLLLGKDKRKGKGKRKNEAERLKPTSGWEDWAKGKKLRRNLKHDYDSD